MRSVCTAISQETSPSPINRADTASVVLRIAVRLLKSSPYRTTNMLPVKKRVDRVANIARTNPSNKWWRNYPINRRKIVWTTRIKEDKLSHWWESDQTRESIYSTQSKWSWITPGYPLLAGKSKVQQLSAAILPSPGKRAARSRQCLSSSFNMHTIHRMWAGSQWSRAHHRITKL